ncbi:MAG TPA: BamA/TamA family outer membrane protein [Thermoanaerobaculia bacterium]
MTERTSACLALALLLAAADCGAQESSAQTPPSPPDETGKKEDSKPGLLDLGRATEKPLTLIPMIIPITEPAVGYGAAGGLILIKRNPQVEGAPPAKPNLAAVGGALTENGTWAVFGAHSGQWKQGKLQTTVAAVYASVNLDYYGISSDGPLASNSIRYNLEPFGGAVQASHRLGDSPWLAGLGYAWAETAISFGEEELPPEISEAELDSSIGGVTPFLTYDTRNNTFTPTTGMYGKLSAGLFADWLGSDFDFEIVSGEVILHFPLSEKLFGGVKADAKTSSEETPFYARPYVDLRGTAIRRYIGDHVAEIEIEARWQAWERWSVVGFAGAGVAWTERGAFDTETEVVTGGAGARYLLVPDLGLHLGLDVGVGPDETAIYVIFGNAWFRP